MGQNKDKPKKANKTLVGPNEIRGYNLVDEIETKEADFRLKCVNKHMR